MTLNTRVHIADPVNAEGLFLHLLGILESEPNFVPSWEDPPDGRDLFRVKPGPLVGPGGKATYRHVRKGDVAYLHAQTGEPIPEVDSEFRSTLGQGLAAIIEVTYGDDGPLEWPPAEDYDEGETPDPAGMPIHAVSVTFDTAYGVRLDNGAGCGDIHAFLVWELALWLAEAGVAPDRWVWQNEYAGTWHHVDELAVLGDAPLAAAHFGRTL